MIAHEPFEHGCEIVAAGAGLAGAQERPWSAGLINVVAVAADGDVGLKQRPPGADAAGPFRPDHDFAGNPAIKRPIVFIGAAAEGVGDVVTAGERAERVDGDVDGLGHVRIGFDAAGVGLLAENPEVGRGAAGGVDVERLRSSSRTPDVVVY